MSKLWVIQKKTSLNSTAKLQFLLARTQDFEKIMNVTNEDLMIWRLKSEKHFEDRFEGVLSYVFLGSVLSCFFVS